MTMTLFPMPRRNPHFAQLHYKLTERCDPDTRNLVYALVRLADGSTSLCHGRDALKEAAGLGRNKYFAAMRRLREMGAIEETSEPEARSGRRVALLWMRDPGWSPAVATDQPEQHAGAPTVGAPSY